MSDDLFRPPGAPWQRVSPALASVRRFVYCLPTAVLGLLLVVAGAAGLSGFPGWLTTLLLVLGVASFALSAWLWRWAGRNTASWGYAENEDDLLVTGGVLFRRLVAVPYRRMQYVDVTAGPLERRYGIATVTLHTASTETVADIPGLPAEEATRLRNRLTELGDVRGAGL